MADKGKLANGFSLPTPGPRTPIKEQAAKKFVSTEHRTVNETSRLRRDGSGERLAVYLPPELAQELRVRCARERRSVSDAVTEAVASWMKD